MSKDRQQNRVEWVKLSDKVARKNAHAMREHEELRRRPLGSRR